MVYCIKCGKKKHTEYVKGKCISCYNNEYGIGYIDDRRNRMWQLLGESACVDCGMEDPRLLEFDHVRGTKRKALSYMVSRGYAWKTIKAEVDKCDIVCANCHRLRTYKRAGSWRLAR